MAQQTGLVSVIIPAYNRARYIQETVESVLSQDYPAIELIAVDDGSSDGTYEILQGYAEKSALTLLSHPDRANRGQSAAINVGLQAAQGEFIAILDSDDTYCAGSIALRVAFLQSHQAVGCVYGNGHAMDAQGDSLSFYTLPTHHQEDGDPNRLLLDCYIALPGGALVRHSVYQQAGFYSEKFRAAQDHDMALRIFEVCKVAYVPEPVFNYRKHQDAISNKGLERRWRAGFEILRRAGERYPYQPRVLRKRAAVLHFRLGQTLWREGRRGEALPHLIKSGLLDPLRGVRVLLGLERVG